MLVRTDSPLYQLGSKPKITITTVCALQCAHCATTKCAQYHGPGHKLQPFTVVTNMSYGCALAYWHHTACCNSAVKKIKKLSETPVTVHNIAKLSSPRAESARAFTGRRCPHNGRGEDFLTGQLIFFTETAVTPERKVEKSFPRWEINRHAEG